MFDINEIEEPAAAGTRRALVVGLVLAVLAGAGLGVYLTARDTTPDSKAAPAPSASASSLPSESPSEAATQTPSASASPTASATASASASASSSASASAAPSASRPAAAAKYPPRGLKLTVDGTPITGNPPGMRFAIRVQDNDGRIRSLTIDYGDGTRETIAAGSSSPCGTRHSSPPPGYRAEPIDRSFSRTHYYSQGGTYRTVISVTTDRPCEAAPVESDSKTVVVRVPNFTPAPSPTRSSSPAPLPPVASPTATTSPTSSPA